MQHGGGRIQACRPRRDGDERRRGHSAYVRRIPGAHGRPPRRPPHPLPVFQAIRRGREAAGPRAAGGRAVPAGRRTLGVGRESGPADAGQGDRIDEAAARGRHAGSRLRAGRTDSRDRGGRRLGAHRSRVRVRNRDTHPRRRIERLPAGDISPGRLHARPSRAAGRGGSPGGHRHRIPRGVPRR